MIAMEISAKRVGVGVPEHRRILFVSIMPSVRSTVRVLKSAAEVQGYMVGTEALRIDRAGA